MESGKYGKSKFLSPRLEEWSTVDEITFKNRTKSFALEIIRLVDSLPRSRVGDVVGRQLLRSGTSVGADYRAACRGKSALDVVAKLGIVEEEADESIYWLELLVDGGIVVPNRIDAINKEANELLAMTVASIKTMRARRQ